MKSPTGKGIRNDNAGSGHYGALRGNGHHKGYDIRCKPGEPIYPFLPGKVIRSADPYGDKKYGGIVIQSRYCRYKILYISPVEELIGTYVNEFAIIGHAQDITNKYPGIGMTAHIHLMLTEMDPEILLKMQALLS